MIIGCNKQNSQIKKDLNSRFSKFEIVEIKKDTANIYSALNRLRALKYMVSSTNFKIVKALDSIESDKNKNKKDIYKYIDSLYENIEHPMTEFEKSKYNKVDPCYYVKFLIDKDENRITKEEYYFINEKNGDILHRPYNWDEFLYEQEYDVLVKDAVKFNSEIFDLRRKYKKN